MELSVLVYRGGTIGIAFCSEHRHHVFFILPQKHYSGHCVLWNLYHILCCDGASGLSDLYSDGLCKKRERRDRILFVESGGLYHGVCSKKHDGCILDRGYHRTDEVTAFELARIRIGVDDPLNDRFPCGLFPVFADRKEADLSGIKA